MTDRLTRTPMILSPSPPTPAFPNPPNPASIPSSNYSLTNSLPARAHPGLVFSDLGVTETDQDYSTDRGDQN